MIKNIFFDLDGTLLDTSFDLAAAANAALEKLDFGKKRYTPEEIKFIVGRGQDNYMRTIIPKELYSEENVTLLKNEYVHFYKNNISNSTVPYDGIVELIDKLTEKGVKVFCLTNKNHDFTMLLLEKFFDLDKFAKIQGIYDGIIPKPDPTCLNNIIHEFSLDKSQCLMVGDTENDIIVGDNAGIKTFGAAWGFKGREFLEKYNPTYMSENPLEILQII